MDGDTSDSLNIFIWGTKGDVFSIEGRIGPIHGDCGYVL